MFCNVISLLSGGIISVQTSIIDSKHPLGLVNIHVPPRPLRVISKPLASKINHNDLDYRSPNTRSSLEINEIYNEADIFSSSFFNFKNHARNFFSSLPNV